MAAPTKSLPELSLLAICIDSKRSKSFKETSPIICFLAFKRGIF